MKSILYASALLALSLTATAQTNARKATTHAQANQPVTKTAQPIAKAGQPTAMIAQPMATAGAAVQPTPVAEAAPQRTAAAATPTRPAPLASSGDRPAYLNVGVGLGAYLAGSIPLGLSFEKTIRDNISVGGSVDYARYGYNYGGYKWHYTFIYVGARGSYHFGELLNVGNPKFDPYAGLSLGFRHASYKDTYGYNDGYYSPYSSGLYLGIHVGSRYMFSEKIGGFAEVGYGVAALRLGLSAKF